MAQSGGSGGVGERWMKMDERRHNEKHRERWRKTEKEEKSD